MRGSRSARLVLAAGFLVAACGSAGASRDDGPAAIGLTPGALSTRATAPELEAPVVADDSVAPDDSQAPPLEPVGTPAPTTTDPGTPEAEAPVPETVPLPTDPAPDAPVPRTGCATVFHIGDSITVGMLDDRALAGRSISDEYTRVGVVSATIDALGGRAVHERRRPDEPTGADAGWAIRRTGAHGCWVFALGTNDAARLTKGSSVSATERIDRMMTIAGGDPVLWVNVVTTTDEGSYRSSGMREFNLALEEAADRYPTLRIFDWAAVARPEWFVGDGIHYTREGYAWRARLIAEALATEFRAP